MWSLLTDSTVCVRVSDSNVDISSLDIQVNAVATVLKAFFSELADPLVPVSYYDELFEASGETHNFTIHEHSTKMFIPNQYLLAKMVE